MKPDAAIRAWVDSFIPGMFNASAEPCALPEGALARVHALGPLVLGEGRERSLFSAVVELARRHPSVRRLLAGKATATGRLIDDAILAAPGDPFFETIPMFRPDLMVTAN